MIKWLHQLFNPHCQHCINEKREAYEESLFCKSCESLSNENNRLIRDNERLLNLVINNSTNKPAEVPVNIEELQPIKPNHVPWNVRRQQIESEKRAEALSRRNAAQPDSINIKEELKELEREMDSVSRDRDNARNK